MPGWEVGTNDAAWVSSLHNKRGQGHQSLRRDHLEEGLIWGRSVPLVWMCWGYLWALQEETWGGQFSLCWRLVDMYVCGSPVCLCCLWADGHVWWKSRMRKGPHIVPCRTPALAGGVLGAEDQVDRPRRGPCQVSQSQAAFPEGGCLFSPRMLNGQMLMRLTLSSGFDTERKLL